MFILRHLELFNALGFWTVRVLFTRSLPSSIEAYENAARELLTVPLSLLQTEELTWFLRQSQTRQLDASAADRVRLYLARKAFRSPRFAAVRRHWMAEGDRAVFLAASPVARDALERRRASVECVELPYNYEHLLNLARRFGSETGETGGMKLSGGVFPLPRRHEQVHVPSLVATFSRAGVSELPVLQNVTRVSASERAALFAARRQGADLSVQRTGA